MNRIPITVGMRVVVDLYRRKAEGTVLELSNRYSNPADWDMGLAKIRFDSPFRRDSWENCCLLYPISSTTDGAE